MLRGKYYHNKKNYYFVKDISDLQRKDQRPKLMKKCYVKSILLLCEISYQLKKLRVSTVLCILAQLHYIYKPFLFCDKNRLLL